MTPKLDKRLKKMDEWIPWPFPLQHHEVDIYVIECMPPPGEFLFFVQWFMVKWLEILNLLYVNIVIQRTSRNNLSKDSV